jgi:haloalkane dehalogenase
MKARRRWLSWLCGGLLLALGACASPTDTRPQVQAYLADFEQRQPAQVHRVPRAVAGMAAPQQLAVREFGARFRGQGPTLVLMHGFPDNQHLYDRVIPQLARTHHVLSFDFLGWGDSDKPQPHRYDVASQRADLEAVVAHFALRSVVPVLHDLSGHAGIDWALANEARCAGLVLLNTYYQAMPTLIAPEAIAAYSTPGWWRDLLVWASGKSAARFQDGVASQIGKFFSDAQMRATFVPVLTQRAGEIQPAFVSSTSVLWDEVAARAQQVPRMQAFNKPVWVIFGADDPYLNVGVAREFARLFPRSQLHLLAGAGHYVQLDQADAVAALILAGLAAR